MNKLIKFGLSILFVILLFSCSKDKSVEPEETGALFPMEVGNEYYLHYYSIDEQNNTGEYTGDSTTLRITETKELDGKTAFYFRNYDGNQLLSQEIYASDDNSIYIHSFTIDDMFSQIKNELQIPIPFDLKQSWLEIYSTNKNVWTAYSDSIDVNYDFNNYLRGLLTVSVIKDGELNITINGQTKKSYKTQMSINFNGVLYIPDTIGDVDVNITINFNHWFVREIGIVRTKRHNAEFDFGFGKKDYQGIETRVVGYKKMQVVE